MGNSARLVDSWGNLASVTHSAAFFTEAGRICSAIDVSRIEALADELVSLRQRGGRLFILGVGGSAGNSSHAVNDFRKLCGIETYTPVDNVSELTARTNDEGWETVFAAWLEVSRLTERDAILIFSVGGGDVERNVSTNIVKAIDFAKARRAKILGIVGKSTGYTAKAGDVVVVIPEVSPDRVTPHSEAFQAVVWHCLVSHPALQITRTKW
jgi:D-sedoheptulose 7-phosphate isomerase